MNEALAPQSTAQPSAIAPLAPSATSVFTTRRVLSILSSVKRKGTWPVPRRLGTVAVMGAVELDFREAVLAPGVNELKVTSVMGAISIIVPPHLHVECDGVGILGHFESMAGGTGERHPDTPLLRITGVAVMGAVEISTQPAGEHLKFDAGTDIGRLGPG